MVHLQNQPVAKENHLPNLQKFLSHGAYFISHRIHVKCIEYLPKSTIDCHRLMPNVGKYTSPMNPMGKSKHFSTYHSIFHPGPSQRVVVTCPVRVSQYLGRARSTPWKINILNPQKWRWMEDDLSFSIGWFLLKFQLLVFGRVFLSCCRLVLYWNWVVQMCEFRIRHKNMLIFVSDYSIIGLIGLLFQYVLLLLYGFQNKAHLIT